MTATGAAAERNPPESLRSGIARLLPIGTSLVTAALVLIFVLARSAGLGEPLPSLWALVAAGVALVSPLPAVLALAALGPFEDWPVLSSPAGGKSVLTLALVASVAVRTGAGWLRAGGPRPDLTAPNRLLWLSLSLNVLLLMGTALGVLHSAIRFGSQFGAGAAALWATGVGTALGLFLVGAWFGRRGEWRPIAVAAAAAVVAGAVGLLQEAAPGLLPASPLAWLVTVDERSVRLASVLNNPNSSGMLMIVPLALAGALVLARPARARLTSSLLLAGPAVVAALAAVLTYSRSTLLASGLVVIAFAWRVRRAVFVAAVAIAIAVLALLVPIYLEVRPDSGSGGSPLPPEFVTRGDGLRLGGWSAAVRMYLDAPLIGQGFRSFQLLHATFGETVVDAPHNEWLRFFAEEGTLVGLAAVGFAVVTLAGLWRGRDAVSLAGFGILLAYAVMACFNNPFNYAQLNICVFIVLGTALGLTWHRMDQRPRMGLLNGPVARLTE